MKRQDTNRGLSFLETTWEESCRLYSKERKMKPILNTATNGKKTTLAGLTVTSRALHNCTTQPKTRHTRTSTRSSTTQTSPIGTSTLAATTLASQIGTSTRAAMILAGCNNSSRCEPHDATPPICRHSDTSTTTISVFFFSFFLPFSLFERNKETSGHATAKRGKMNHKFA